MKYEVFISYRREDTQKSANILQKSFDDHKITAFFDKTDINLSENWSDKIENALKECLVVLILIGKKWNEKRLHQENDWVLKEFNIANKEKKPIIPILIDREDIPTEESLPKSIRELFEKQGLPVDTDRFSDITDLIDRIKLIILKNAYGKEVVEFLKQKNHSSRYTLKDTLSNKSNVIICKARDLQLERDVVIRFYKDSKTTAELKKTLYNAIQFSKNIPHCVQIFDADYKQYPHIVLGFMEGGSLRSKIDAGNGSPSKTVANHLKQIGRALRDVAVQHCNIKPTNILLGKDSKNLYLNPLNRWTEVNKEKIRQDIIESKKSEDLAYTAPEIFNHDLQDKEGKNQEEKIDQYQLGLVGIELLTGKMPCTFEKVEELLDPPTEEVIRERTQKHLFPPQEKLHSIFLRMTEPHAGKRYPSLAEAIEEIAESTLKLSDTEIVRKSYIRCLNTNIEDKGFLQSFYEEFIEDPMVKEKFEKFSLKEKNKDSMRSQYNHLQGALFGLIEYATLIAEGEDRDEIKLLEHIAKKHGKGKGKKQKQNYYIDIGPSLLPWFKQVLIGRVCGKGDEAIGAFDQHCNESKTDREIIKEAWEKVLAPGLEYMDKVIRNK